MDEQAGLSFSESERRALLLEAAHTIDARLGHLGDSGQITPTEEGDLLRSFLDDKAAFDKDGNIYPHKFSRLDFTSRKIPIEFFEGASQNFNFYQVRIPFNLVPRPDWGFNWLEMHVKLSATGDSQPIAYRILPNKQVQNLLSISSQLAVRLGANFEFEASVPTIPVIPAGPAGMGVGAQAEAHAKAGGDVDIVFGPYIFRWQKSKIFTDGKGTTRVTWRIDGAEFFQEDLDLVIIIQAPKLLSSLVIHADLKAGRYFNLASANMIKAIKQLREALRIFFDNGAPILDNHSWTVSLL